MIKIEAAGNNLNRRKVSTKISGKWSAEFRVKILSEHSHEYKSLFLLYLAFEIDIDEVCAILLFPLEIRRKQNWIAKVVKSCPDILYFGG